MTLEATFLFDNQLISELESLIKNSNNQLLLISPFIDLDNRIKDALKEKIKKPAFQLRVLFGKNETNIYKSIKQDSIEFLKEFPDVEIRYEERLHAKFYLNDTHFLLTSLNLYDYSLAKNIETGILVHHTSKGLIGKIADEAGELIYNGIDKIKSDVLGMGNKEENPILKFNQIFENSKLLYKTEPILKDKKGITGFLGKKEILDFNVVKNDLEQIKGSKKFIPKTSQKCTEIKIKFLSATNLGKIKGKSFDEVIEIMCSRNYLYDKNTITSEGEKLGIKIKESSNGSKWIVYPESLAEIL